jgi:hypothetical protein
MCTRAFAYASGVRFQPYGGVGRNGLAAYACIAVALLGVSACRGDGAKSVEPNDSGPAESGKNDGSPPDTNDLRDSGIRDADVTSRGGGSGGTGGGPVGGRDAGGTSGNATQRERSRTCGVGPRRHWQCRRGRGWRRGRCTELPRAG